MESNAEKAKRLFDGSCNCCQAVLAALAGPDGPDEAQAMRLGATFGGGMRRGEMCGAAVGALMALGLRQGGRNPCVPDAKVRLDALTVAYLDAFEARFGACRCRDLLHGAGRGVCMAVVPGAVELLEALERSIAVASKDAPPPSRD